MSDNKPTCGNCPYFDGGADKKGLCRNMKPNVLKIDGQPTAVWPIVDGADWCGMHPMIDFMKQQKMIAMLADGGSDMMLAIKDKLDDVLNR